MASLSAYAMHKPSKMPSLESLTKAKAKPRVQTMDEMKSVFARMRRRAERNAG